MKKQDIWFMEDYPLKEIVRNFLSVVVGVLLGLLVYLLISIGVNSRLNRIESSNGHPITKESRLTLSALGLIVGALAGGGLTASISTRKDKTHAGITGIVLSVILFYLFKKTGHEITPLKITICFLVAIAGLTGGLLNKKSPIKD